MRASPRVQGEGHLNALCSELPWNSLNAAVGTVAFTRTLAVSVASLTQSMTVRQTFVRGERVERGRRGAVSTERGSRVGNGTRNLFAPRTTTVLPPQCRYDHYYHHYYYCYRRIISTKVKTHLERFLEPCFSLKPIYILNNKCVGLWTCLLVKCSRFTPFMFPFLFLGDSRCLMHATACHTIAGEEQKLLSDHTLKGNHWFLPTRLEKVNF